MRRMTFLLYQVFVLILVVEDSGCHLEVVSEGSDWGYTGNTGPSNWCKMAGYEKCCNTRTSRQSPIDIVTRITQKKKNTLKLVGYEKLPRTMEAINKGNTAELTFSIPVIPTMSGGPLKSGDTYYLDYIHAHWGHYRGSEHKIDGKQTQMEFHFMHHNSKYKSTMEGMKYSDGLAVLGVLVVASSHDNPAFTSLISNLKNIRRAGQNVTMKAPFISSFLPRKVDIFFSYPGSLTTPPCSESVTWIVFPDYISMSQRQMAEFRTLYTNKEGEHNNNNFRPTQPINGRTVELWSSR